MYTCTDSTIYTNSLVFGIIMRITKEKWQAIEYALYTKVKFVRENRNGDHFFHFSKNHFGEYLPLTIHTS